MSKKIKFEARVDSFMYQGTPTLILDAPKPVQSGLYRVTLERAETHFATARGFDEDGPTICWSDEAGHIKPPTSKWMTKAEMRRLDAEYE